MLFKILQGNEINLPATLHDGYCYFLKDKHYFYVDYIDDNHNLVRSKLSAEYADRLRYFDGSNIVEIAPEEIALKEEIDQFLRVDVTIPDDDIRTISIPFANGEYETVMVYLNGLLLFENEHYIINADHTISFVGYTVGTGDLVTFINKGLTPLNLQIKADAKLSESWAIGGTNSRSGEDTNNSKYYATLAESYKNAAASSENASKISETNAKTSETNAEASETAAKASEDSAKDAQTAAEVAEYNAKVSENKAKTSETNAKASEDAAELAQTKAETAESNAKASETNAKTSETNAKASEDAAELAETNAKYWYQQVANIGDITNVVRIVEQDFTAAQRLQARKNINIQVSAMPTPSNDYLGQIIQYVGVTDTQYTKGYSYECVLEDGVYLWNPIETGAQKQFYISLPASNWVGTDDFEIYTSVHLGVVTVDSDIFIPKVLNIGTYIFEYDEVNSTWTITNLAQTEHTAITLSEYGIALEGTAYNKDLIIIKYDIVSPYMQTVDIADVTPTSKIDLQADYSIIRSLSEDRIYHLYIANDNGVCTAVASTYRTAPSVDLNIQATIVEVKTE